MIRFKLTWYRLQLEAYEAVYQLEQQSYLVGCCKL